MIVAALVALVLALVPGPGPAGPWAALDHSPAFAAGVDHGGDATCPAGVLAEEDRDEEGKSGPGEQLVADLSAASLPLVFRHGVSGALGPLVDHSCGHLGDGAPGATRAPPLP
jgi:hypothetical protein